MTQHDICKWLLNNGAKEYHDRTKDPDVRCFSLARCMPDAPNCACNHRPPSLHIHTYPDVHAHGKRFPGGVEFEVAGEAGDGRWLRAVIYCVQREEVEEALPDVRKTAAAVWTAFFEGLKHRKKEIKHVDVDDGMDVIS